MESKYDIIYKIESRNEFIKNLLKENKELLEKNIIYKSNITYIEDKILNIEKNYYTLNKQYSKLVNNFKNEIEYTNVLDKANNDLLDKINLCKIENNEISDKNDELHYRVNELKKEYNEKTLINTSLQIDLKENNDKLNLIKSAFECKICADENISVILNPCGHINCCVTCINKIMNDNNLKKCPICNNVVESWKRIYFPI